MKKIIIGKNSRIAKLICNKFPDIRAISHSEAFTFNFQEYDEILFFGWDYKNPNEALGLLSWLDPSKLIFISTVSIYSIQLRKQWAKYPIYKSLGEKLVLDRGGAIARLGRVLSENHSEKFSFISAVTPIKLLYSYIQSTNKTRVTNLFQLTKSNTSYLHSKICSLLHSSSRIFPSYSIFQAPFSLLGKTLKFKSYGYSADSELFFCNSIQIGFGALGSIFYKNSKSDIVFHGELPNIDLIGNGFNGTLVGRFNKGLGEFWHGVSIINKNGTLKKRVPLIVKRPNPPLFSSRQEHVCQIKYEFNRWQLTTISKYGLRDYFCNRLILAAGPIENTRLLSSLCTLDAKFDDHITFFSGKITSKAARKMGLIGKLGPISLRKNLIHIQEDDQDFICDVRPLTNRSPSDSASLYKARTASIFRKLLLKADLKLINEAIFNKFGFCLYTKYMSVYVQLLAKDCINLTAKNGAIINISKSPPNLDKILSKLTAIFTDLGPSKNFILLDTHHIVGGKSLLELEQIKLLTDELSLIIVGSPTNFKMSGKHHTEEMRSNYA